MEISSKAVASSSANVCTGKNFPLYGISRSIQTDNRLERMRERVRILHSAESSEARAAGLECMYPRVLLYTCTSLNKYFPSK
jgi:hypothetical protein